MSKQENQESTEQAVQEFLARGGEITQCGFGKSGRVEGQSYSMWSKKKPAVSPLATAPEEED